MSTRDFICSPGLPSIQTMVGNFATSSSSLSLPAVPMICG